MNQAVLIFISVLLILSIVVSIVLYKLKKANVKMGFTSFIKYLLFGTGFSKITAKALKKKIDSGKNNFMLANLSIKKENKALNSTEVDHIEFDDFIKKMVIDEIDEIPNDLEIIIMCDTGKLSKVASGVLVDEGYTNVYNLSGGLENYNNANNF